LETGNDSQKTHGYAISLYRKTGVEQILAFSRPAVAGFTGILLPDHFPMYNIILFQPEIPPNTGNIIRLCGNSSAKLHLVGPMGFELEHAKLRRAGLDYHDLAIVSQYRNWEDFRNQHPNMPIWAFSTKGHTRYDRVDYAVGDGLLFGPETRGLPQELLSTMGPRVLRLPMQLSSRSLNLSNTVAIALYEALRQTDFAGMNEEPVPTGP
jgi:tRNA (cytidine/uridine-2'-O-)-methyltransferase